MPFISIQTMMFTGDIQVRLRALHGYFIFEETQSGQISDYMSLTDFSIVPVGRYYTFEALELAPRYSIQAKSLLGVPALKTFEGEPWEVFEENEIVYDFRDGIVKPISSIVLTTEL